VIGPAERISPYDALRAVTAMAAYQIKEEKSKGSQEAGKLADLVIIQRNPLKGDPGRIGTIRVLETIKEGQPIYRISPKDLGRVPAPPAICPEGPHNYGGRLLWMARQVCNKDSALARPEHQHQGRIIWFQALRPLNDSIS
jgi:hypothetical protein